MQKQKEKAAVNYPAMDRTTVDLEFYSGSQHPIHNTSGLESDSAALTTSPVMFNESVWDSS